MTPRLTEPQIRQLRFAVHGDGFIRFTGTDSGRPNFESMMRRMCEGGHFIPEQGGYAITQLGRDAFGKHKDAA